MDKPTELHPVDPDLVTIQSDIREHFGWDLNEDISSAQEMLERTESYDIRSWERPSVQPMLPPYIADWFCEKQK